MRGRAAEWREVEERGWDVLVVGGGATGLACGLDAASRGACTLVVERGDLGQGTSSRSTKLIHGGVRYLRQGDVGLVRESLRERGWFLRQAPEIVHWLRFVIPCYGRGEGWFYGLGMGVYDRLAGADGGARSRRLGMEEVLEEVPGCREEGLRGGVLYEDGQFDDAAMLVCMRRTILREGGRVLTQAEVTGVFREGGRVAGVRVRDRLTGVTGVVRARVVINAAGVYSDEIRRMGDGGAERRIAASQGIHVVLDGSWLGGGTALMIPRTEDGRVLFAIPWMGKTLLGTTDRLVAATDGEPMPAAEEVGYLLRHGGRMFHRVPEVGDVRSVFAGLRPLISGRKGMASAKLRRDFEVERTARGMVSVFGGKWTTCRRMAEVAVDAAWSEAGLARAECRTGRLELVRLAGRDVRGGGVRLHEGLSLTREDVVMAVEQDGAWRVEDVLGRRSRALQLDLRASAEVAEAVARIMADRLGGDERWVERECQAVREGVARMEAMLAEVAQ
ncbi:MAG TPA: glycerol-3-phosphate dehydrogenase/oxidase [Kiritimatiellia bacterium]|nr:glycerol-3-phosphate dehydrogenase/oxidase [Kiritimatiellia bacterium]